MAHVDGGYVISTGTGNIIKSKPISQNKLKEVAALLGVPDAADIKSVFVYGDGAEPD
jgi:hypothetical protein